MSLVNHSWRFQDVSKSYIQCQNNFGNVLKAIAFVIILVVIVMSIGLINVIVVTLLIVIITFFLLFPHYPRYRHYYYHHQCSRPRVIVIEVIPIDLRYRFHTFVIDAITILTSIFVIALTIAFDVVVNGIK